MKLHEVITEKVELDQSTPIDFQGRQWLPISGEMAGDGVQARVYKTGTGMVTKIAVLDKEEGLRDPAVEFLNIILQYQNNPFFPKIYHARVYRDKAGEKNPILLVQMEKLLPIADPKIQDATAGLFNQLGIGTKNLSPEFVKQGKKYDKSIQTIMSKTSALNMKLRDAWMDNDIKAAAKLGSRSKNPQFREAIQTLAPAIIKHGSDLHWGNWMVRLTGAGPQLVIIDPFAPSSTPNLSNAS